MKAPIDILGLSNGARSGLTGFIAGLARNPEIAAQGVTINNLLPGKFDTDRLNTTLEGAAHKSGKSLDEVRAAQAAQYREWALGVAEKVAMAATEGGFLGFGGTRLSDAEKALIEQIKRALQA